MTKSETEKAAEEKLSPCPFCGGKAEKMFIGNDHTKERSVNIKCTKCYTEQRTGAIHHDHAWCDRAASEKWNNRATFTTSVKEKVDIEKLRDEYKKVYYKIMGYHVDFGLDDEGRESNGKRLFDFFKPHLTGGKEKIDWDDLKKSFLSRINSFTSHEYDCELLVGSLIKMVKEQIQTYSLVSGGDEKWISVGEEYLPDRNVLVVGGAYKSITIVRGSHINYIIKNKGTTDLIPTLWRELPSPPPQAR